MLKSFHQGFTLIEALIIVAVLAILAAIALPAYQDYSVRQRISELLNAAASTQQTIDRMCADRRGCNNIEGVVLPSSPHLASARVNSLGILVLEGNNHLGTEGFRATLTPSWNGQTVAWSCNSSLPRLTPANCRG